MEIGIIAVFVFAAVTGFITLITAKLSNDPKGICPAGSLTIALRVVGVLCLIGGVLASIYFSRPVYEELSVPAYDELPIEDYTELSTSAHDRLPVEDYTETSIVTPWNSVLLISGIISSILSCLFWFAIAKCVEAAHVYLYKVKQKSEPDPGTAFYTNQK